MLSLGSLAFFVLCCGGDLATASTARSKRAHTLECRSARPTSFEDFAMPQPMSTTRPIHFDFSPLGALKRPNLGAYVTVISNFWNEIEAQIAIFLAALLGAEASTVLTIFLAIQSDSAKRAVIDKIVLMKLDKTQQATFSTAMDLIGRRYTERNKCVHGAWGFQH